MFVMAKKKKKIFYVSISGKYIFIALELEEIVMQ